MDIRIYIASLLYRAIIHKPIAYMYYTQDRLFETPEFKRILPQFVDITELSDTYGRSAKIEPIYSYLVERWQSILTLECEVSVDETLLLWKSRLSWKQYIKTKRARFGMKTLASSGYIWNSIIYARDDTLIDEGNKYQYQAASYCQDSNEISVSWGNMFIYKQLVLFYGTFRWATKAVNRSDGHGKKGRK